jgi:hypothetical protein
MKSGFCASWIACLDKFRRFGLTTPILTVDKDQGFCCIMFLAGKAEVSTAGEHLAKE